MIVYLIEKEIRYQVKYEYTVPSREEIVDFLKSIFE